jgi:hypothetical protein
LYPRLVRSQRVVERQEASSHPAAARFLGADSYPGFHPIDAGTASSSPFQRTTKIVHDRAGIVFTFPWRLRSRCAGNRVHKRPEYAIPGRVNALAFTLATTLAGTCAAVRRTAKHHKHPDRARLPFTAAERIGLIINLNVGKYALTRALLLADRFIQTAEAIGWPLTDPPPPGPPSAHRERWEQPAAKPTLAPPTARLLVDGEPISFLIEERYREESREPTSRELAREKKEYEYHAPRTIGTPTGALRIVRIDTVYDWSPRRKSWYDQGSHLVEEKLPKILAAFFERAQEIKEARAECERRQRERAEEERLRKEQEDRRDAHDKLRAELERQAGAWHRGRFLRRYVRAARHSLGNRIIERPFLDKQIDFFELGGKLYRST